MLRKKSFLLFFFLSIFFISFFSSCSKKSKTEIFEPKVYVTEYGTKYHSPDCHYLRSSRIAIGEYQAQKQGYTACVVCGGKSKGTIQINKYEQNTEEGGIDSDFILLIVFLGGTGLFIIASHLYANKK